MAQLIYTMPFKGQATPANESGTVLKAVTSGIELQYYLDGWGRRRRGDTAADEWR